MMFNKSVYVKCKHLLAGCGFLFLSVIASAISFTDASNTRVEFKSTPTRVIALSPHLTELMYAAGAGKYLVAVSAYSDYPLTAKSLPVVADYYQMDIEKIAGLKPDVVLVWKSGGQKEAQLKQLRALNIPMLVLEQSTLSDVSKTIRQFGELFATQAQANLTAQAFDHHIEEKRLQYLKVKKMKVFFQVWDRPLMTVNRWHVISDVFNLCGGENVFASMNHLTPSIDPEAVVLAKPEAMFVAHKNTEPLNRWRAFKIIPAVAKQHFFKLTPDYISRMSPRLVFAIDEVCSALNIARQIK